jgi:hypothetical protein
MEKKKNIAFVRNRIPVVQPIAHVYTGCSSSIPKSGVVVVAAVAMAVTCISTHQLNLATAGKTLVNEVICRHNFEHGVGIIIYKLHTVKQSSSLSSSSYLGVCPNFQPFLLHLH